MSYDQWAPRRRGWNRWSRFRRTALLPAVGLTCAIPAAGSAQESPPSRAIEEVVVTAQRAEERVQDVPIAVSAFTGGMMEDKQIVTPSDLQLNAPNVSFTATNFGGSSFSIRGIGNLVISASADPGVSIHQNEIPLSTNLPAAEFYDMERVEVLRGPQGTLFGRNATGGVVNFVTRKPDFEGLGGFIDGEYGGYNHTRVKGALNVPITDSFAVRVAGMYLNRDGYIDNVADGQVGDCLVPGSTLGNAETTPCELSGIDDDVDGRDLWSGRLTALWDISDNASMWVQYSRFDEDDDRVRITNQVCERNTIPTIGCKPDGFGFDTPHAGTTTGGIYGGLVGAVVLGDPVPDRAFVQPDDLGFRDMHTDFEPVYQYEEDTFLGAFNYDFEEYSFSLQAGYQESSYLTRQDYNMDVGFNLYASPRNPTGLWPTSEPAPELGGEWTNEDCNYNDGTAGIFGGCVLDVDQTRVFAYDQSTNESESWTVEAKVQSAYAGPFNFILGTNYMNSESQGDYNVVSNTLDLVGSFGVPGVPPLYPTMFNNNTSGPGGGTEFEGYSVFGETYFDLTPDVKLTAGLRYNHDEKDAADSSVLYNSLDLAALVPGTPRGTWMRAALAPLLNPAAIGTPAAADAQQLAEYYGVYDSYLSAMGGGNFEQAVGALLQVPLAPGFGENRDLTGSPSHFEWDEVTGRFGVDIQVAEDSMVYAFYSKGYKPGGFNPALNQDFVDSTAAAYSFDSEEIDAIEVGTKNMLLDGTLMLNASMFMYDYQGLQVTRILNNNSINDNINADILGAELETVWQPADFPGLSLDLAYSWLKAEVSGSASVDPTNRTAGNDDYILLENIDGGVSAGVNYIARRDQITDQVIADAYASCQALSAQNPLNGTACPLVAPGAVYDNGVPAYFSRAFLESQNVETSDGFGTELAGNTLPNSPEHTVHLGAAYTWPIGAIAGSLTARYDYYWQSKMYAREYNTPGDEIDAWDQHNASLIYESNDGHWMVKAWVRNLADEDNITGHYLTSDTSGFYRNYFLTEPRIWGASVRYSFDRM